MMREGKDCITQIQDKIKQQQEIGGIWEGYCNLQKLASGDIWESSTRYIYELLQNAEDAGAKEFKVYISKKRAKITHNGNPLTPEDIRNICYAATQKDPNVSIGYLGVGFRSVFPVTDKPEIYGGKYSFRFDKEACEREFGDSSLYHFYPFWIEQPTERIDQQKTTFILDFKAEEYFTKALEQLGKLGTHSLLFLRNINSIIIRNEENNESRVCNISCLEDFKPIPNNGNLKLGKFLLVDGSVATRFLVFRGTFQTDEVRKDKETIRAKRGEIKEREVSIAFQLDEKDNLKPIKGYFYSFFPVMERKINYLVHADFIVQAGRIALLDNKWNKWMTQKAFEVAEGSYHYFQEKPDEPKWVEQFPTVFEKREEVGDMYEDVFEKHLYEATKNPIVRDLEGKIIPLNKAIKITEETEELVKRGFIKSSDLETVFEEELYLIRKDYPTGGRPVKELDIDDLNCEEFLEKKTEEGKGVDFLILFYSLYKKAVEERYSHYKQSQQEGLIKSALGELLVINRKGGVKKQEDVRAEPDLKVLDKLKGKGFEIERILSEYDLIGKTLWEKARAYLPKVREITKEVVQQSILLKLNIASEPPSKEDVVSWAHLLKSYGASPNEEIWVLDANGQVRTSKGVFLSDKYDPLYRWQGFKLPEMNFLSDEYLDLEGDPNGWKEFFKETSMKGYNKLDYQDYVRNNILLPLQQSGKARDLSNHQVIQYTRAMVECDFTPEGPIFVVTKEGAKQKSDSELYFPSQYSPKENWENQGIISLNFVSSEYINQNDVNKWKEFFKAIGIKEIAAAEMIAEFGKRAVMRKFEKDGYIVEPYGGKYDLQAKKDSEVLYIEVKSISAGDVGDIRFDSGRARFSEGQARCYYLANIINIPDAPYIYLLKDPANRDGVTYEMHIPKDTIEKYSEKIDAKHLVNKWIS